MSQPSLLREIVAPAPRYMMRLVLVEQLLEKLPGPVTSFLEIGPGMGDLSLSLCRRFPAVTGDLYEISPESVQFLSARFRSTPQLTVHPSDFLELERRSHYDLAIACEVFEHIEDDEQAFDRIYQSLKIGGHFLFSVPAGMDKWGPADEYAGHLRRYERQELVEKFDRHNLTILHLWSYGFPLTLLTNRLSNLYYARLNASGRLSRDDATKRSGSERTVARWLRRLPMATLLTPYFFCQDRVKETDRGDGYLVLARK